MTDSRETPKRRASRRSDPKALARFVEELSWLLSSHDDLDFKALGNLSSELAYASRTSRNLLAHADRGPTARFLVGVLPSLLIDEKLFPSNEDIADFAQSILGIMIPRWQKKSKYELIGHIVCHTDQASPSSLNRLVDAFGSLLDGRGSARAAAARQRRSGASWNEVIQSLLSSAR